MDVFIIFFIEPSLNLVFLDYIFWGSFCRRPLNKIRGLIANIRGEQIQEAILKVFLHPPPPPFGREGVI